MDKPSRPKKPATAACMLGVGLDADGHKRITTGPNFMLFGGKDRTHKEMTETALKINQELSSRGKTLENVGVQELADVLHTVGLRRS
jgi:hypothetical protein